MYTDWGNLKIVSRRAWFQGLDPAAQRSAGGMDALGASIFTFKRTEGPLDTMNVPIGRCRNSRVEWSLLLIQKHGEFA